MTRKQVIDRLTVLGFEDPEIKYLDIRDFLHYNRTPVKAITRIELADTDGRDSSYWTTHCYLTDSEGNDWGTVEV